jgi:hypothetical protein
LKEEYTVGEIRFYEGPECTQHYIGKIVSNVNSEWNLALISSPIADGAAQSCALIDVKKGVRIRLYNAPIANDDAGCTEILVKADVDNKEILYFTEGHTDDEVEVKVHPGQGDVGKVSRVEVRGP